MREPLVEQFARQMAANANTLDENETGAKNCNSVRTGEDDLSLAFAYAWMGSRDMFLPGALVTCNCRSDDDDNRWWRRMEASRGGALVGPQYFNAGSRPGLMVSSDLDRDGLTDIALGTFTGRAILRKTSE